MPLYIIERKTSLSIKVKLQKVRDHYVEKFEDICAKHLKKSLNVKAEPGDFLDINRRKRYKSTFIWTVQKLVLSSHWNVNNLIIIKCPPSTRGCTLAMLEGIEKQKLSRDCLISVGATAEFPELIQAALSEESLEQFAKCGYTRVVFQVGNSIDYFHDLKPLDAKGLDITAFTFNKTGLGAEMRICQAKKGVSEEGLVISHAGAGTILDALRLGLPLIVVPNLSLLDNHQEELATELERQGYVIKSDIKNLAAAICKAEKRAKKDWGGPNSSGSFSAIVDHMVGYEDEVRGRLD